MNGANEKVKFLLNWNHFSDHVSNSMAKLMTDSSYSDVIIATGDKRMIYAHRFVLANSSKYFQRLLKQMSKQRGVQLVVALPEVKYEIFKILMNYMYRGESQVPHELLPSVIRLGRILEINGLIDLHDADNAVKGASIWKCHKAQSGESQSEHSVIRSSSSSSGKVKGGHHHVHHDGGNSKKTGQDRPPSAHRHHPQQHEKMRSRESSLNEHKRKTKCQNLDIDSTSEAGATRAAAAPAGGGGGGGGSGSGSGSGTQHKNGMVRRFRPILPKNEEAAAPNGKRDSGHLHGKRKLAGKEVAAEKETPSSSTENPSKKKCPPIDDNPTLVPNIKREKVDESDWDSENQPEEEITIKTELPFETDEVNYNELLCDYCNESYTNPSDWVRHMTDRHGDRGYQTYKDLEKEGRGESVYTCVICSTVLLSAAEWARHLRAWHTETELAKANKMANRSKKDSDSKGTPIKD